MPMAIQLGPDPRASSTPAPPSLDATAAAALAGEYRILRLLAPGGMGDVFLAEQLHAGHRKVALKVLHRRFGDDEEVVARLQETAAVTQRLRHPNIVTTYECKRAPNGPVYVAMEWVEGASLADHLSTYGRLPLGEVIDIVSQCCQGLHAAHQLGIIHRNVAPKNILLGRDSAGALLAKILDFSLAKVKESSGHTATGCVVGTPTYMSYEQASGLSSEKLDGRSDIYSLGLVTYAMLVGRPPFRAETAVRCIMMHLLETPPSIRGARPDVPLAMEAAVMKALEKDRGRRYPTALEFAAAVREAGKGPTPLPDVLADLDTPPHSAFPPPWRRRPSAEIESRATPPAARYTR